MRPQDNDHRREAFEKLYEANYRDVGAYVARRVTPHEIDDVVSQTFTVAWRRIESVPQPPEDRLWLFGVARRCLSDSRRSSMRRLRLSGRLAREEQARMSRSVSSNDDPRLDLVMSAIASLAASDRESLQLVLWEGLTHAEAARVLGCTTNAFEIRYRRARNVVKASVDSSEDDPLERIAQTRMPTTPEGAQ
jgi:RNA polymerase sigma factor (sigma-70 family)